MPHRTSALAAVCAAEADGEPQEERRQGVVDAGEAGLLEHEARRVQPPRVVGKVEAREVRMGRVRLFQLK